MGSRAYTASEKAALIVAGLGEDLAPAILGLMPPSEASKLLRAMNGLGRIEQSEIDRILHEFLNLLQAPKRPPSPGDFLGRLLPKLNASQQELARSVLQQDYQMRIYDRATSEQLYRVIQNEVPQTVALILAHAPSAYAAQLLKQFAESQRIELLLRMAKIREVDPQLLQEIDDLLIQAIEQLGGRGAQKLGGSKRVAAILNAMHEESGMLLKQLAERDQSLAESIEQEMFVFEDIQKIDVRGIQEIIKSLKREILILALRGADETMVRCFASAMSERSSQMLREDIEALGAQKKSDILKARQELLALVRSLIENGRILFDPHQEAI